MYIATILLTNEFLNELFPTEYDAKRAALEYILEHLRQEPGGIRILSRMGGRVSWSWAKDHISIDKATDQWIAIVEGTETPDFDCDEGTIVFICRKKSKRHLGGFDTESGCFVEDGTDATFHPSKVSAFMLLSDAEDGSDEEIKEEPDEEDEEQEAPPAGAFSHHQ